MRTREYDLPVPNLRSIRDISDPSIIRIRAPENTWLTKQFHMFGLRRFEIETLSSIAAMAQLHLQAPDKKAFLDIGANIGTYAHLVGKFFGDKLQVVAFEPFPDTRTVAQTIARDNDIDCEIRAEAVGAADGQAELFLSSVSDTSHSLVLNEKKYSGRRLSVRTVSIDSFCRARHLSVAFAKLDTEGNEPDVLEGALEVLTRDRPTLIVEVLTLEAARDIAERLAGLDYIYYPISRADAWSPRTEMRPSGDRNWLLAPALLDDRFHELRRGYSLRLRRCHTPLRGVGRGVQADAFRSGEMTLLSGEHGGVFLGSSHGQLLISSNNPRIAGGFSFVCRSSGAHAAPLYVASDKVEVRAGPEGDTNDAAGKVIVRFDEQGWVTLENHTEQSRTISYTVVGSLPPLG